MFNCSDLRSPEERVRLLKNIPSNDNYRLNVPPQKNLTSADDCQSSEFSSFVQDFQVPSLKDYLLWILRKVKFIHDPLFCADKCCQTYFHCYLLSTFRNQNYVSFLSVTDTLHQGSVYELKVKIIILMQLLLGDMVKSQHYS